MTSKKPTRSTATTYHMIPVYRYEDTTIIRENSSERSNTTSPEMVIISCSYSCQRSFPAQSTMQSAILYSSKCQQQHLLHVQTSFVNRCNIPLLVLYSSRCVGDFRRPCCTLLEAKRETVSRELAYSKRGVRDIQKLLLCVCTAVNVSDTTQTTRGRRNNRIREMLLGLLCTKLRGSNLL